MAISLASRIRIGFSLALLTVLTVSGSLLLGKVDMFRPHLYAVVFSIAGAGLIFLVVGRLKLRKAREEAAEQEQPVVFPEDQPSEESLLEHPLGFFKRVDYWGWMLLTSATAILCFTTLFYKAAPPVQPVQKPKPVAKVEVQAPVVVEEEAPPFEFPPMKLSGFVCNGAKSSAVINKTTIHVGESADGIKLVAVESDGVIVEVKGNQKRLTQDDRTTGVLITALKGT